jgi:hypothetical protein
MSYFIVCLYPVSNTDQSVWHLWWRLSKGKVSLRVLRLAPIDVIPPLLRTFSVKSALNRKTKQAKSDDFPTELMLKHDTFPTNALFLMSIH